MNGWGASKPFGGGGWQQQSQPSWMMPMGKGGGPPGPPPGPPGPPPGWGFPDPSGGMPGMKGGGWGGDFDGPYMGDANTGVEEDWGGGGGWKPQKGKGGSQSWGGASGRGRGGKDGQKGPIFDEDESW